MEPVFNNELINHESFPVLEDDMYHTIGKNYLSVLLFTNSVSFIIVAILVLINYFFNPLNLPEAIRLVILICFILILLTSFYSIIRGFREKGYLVRERDISYKTGWIWKSFTTVPFNRIQHCEVKEGLLERFCGLASLHVYTAGGSSSDLSVPGLGIEDANSLKSIILDKINAEQLDV